MKMLHGKKSAALTVALGLILSLAPAPSGVFPSEVGHDAVAKR